MALPAELKKRLGVAAAGGAVAIATVLVGWFEGRSLVAYLDPIGIPTICDGDTAGVRMGDRATPAECDERTRRALEDAQAVFDRWVPAGVRADMAPATKASFWSFIYNVGPGKPGVKDGFVWLKNGRHSTMLLRLLAGNVRAACEQMPSWIKAGGRVLRGLVLRREAEMTLCLSGLR